VWFATGEVLRGGKLMGIQARIGSIPIVGYVLKVLHDIAMLPVIRRHLLLEIRTLESQTIARREFSGEITALEQRLSDEVRTLEQYSIPRREFTDEITEMERRVLESVAAVERGNSDHIEQHVIALAAFARGATREQTELARQLTETRERVAALESDLARILEALEATSPSHSARELPGPTLISSRAAG